MAGSLGLVLTTTFTGLGGPAAEAGTARPAVADTPAPALPPYVVAAEGVAGPFISAFESYSYTDAPDAVAGRVAPFTTPKLQNLLASPSQGGVGAAVSAEQASAQATAGIMQVESATPTQVSLLVTAVVHVTSTNGSSVNERFVPVTVVATDSGWRVADVDSLIETAPPPPSPSATPPAGGDGTPAPTPAPPAPSPPEASMPTAGTPGHVDGIPDDYLHWYEGAATTCPGLSWTILAAIGTVESDNGQSDLPGVHSGSNSAGAEGPMQFMPGTWAAYATVAPGGADPADVYDPPDAIWSAAKLLCNDGAGNPGGLYAAIFAYNHSDAYVADVLAIASRYAAASGAGAGSSAVGLGSVIVRDAESYLGTPYVWGGETPGGFDCSGLVQWVYAQAGIDMPRVAQDQYNAGPHLPTDAELYAGDLVFFGSGSDGVEHVGIYVGGGNMIDAPHTGAVVRIEPVAGFDPPYVGATRPEIPDLSSSGPGLPTVVGAPDAHKPQPGSGGGGSGGPGSGSGHQGSGSGHHHPPTSTTSTSTPTHSTSGTHHHPPGSTTTSTSHPTTTTTWHHNHPTSGTTSTSHPTTTTTRPAPTTTTTWHHTRPTSGPTTSTVRPPTTTTTWRHPTTTTTTRPPEPPPAPPTTSSSSSGSTSGSTSGSSTSTSTWHHPEPTTTAPVTTTPSSTSSTWHHHPPTTTTSTTGTSTTSSGH